MSCDLIDYIVYVNDTEGVLYTQLNIKYVMCATLW